MDQLRHPHERSRAARRHAGVDLTRLQRLLTAGRSRARPQKAFELDLDRVQRKVAALRHQIGRRP